MKKVLILSLSSLLFWQCRKVAHEIPPSGTSLIREAQLFVSSLAANQITGPDANPRVKCPRTVDWSRAITETFDSGTAVVAPLVYRDPMYISTSAIPGGMLRLDNISRLMVIRDRQQKLHAEIVTALPDNVYDTSGETTFSGIILIEEWNGNLIARYKYDEDGKILTYGPASGTSRKALETQTQTDKTAPAMLIQVCYEIFGYNYSSADPSGTVYWSEFAGCDYEFSGTAPSLATLSPTDYSTALTASAVRYIASKLIVASPSNPIADIQQYFKCFTSSPAIDHTYSVTICVDEPDPGTRQAWGITNGGPIGSSAAGNPVNSGHSFFVLTENDGGRIITRNVGFYPTSFVSPLSTSSQGILNNDEGHSYSVSITWQVSNTQFFDILNYISVGNNQGYMYDLNTNNCTTFAIHAAAAGSIATPATVGSWALGRGNDPGDYGADFRLLPLSSSMSRNTVPPNSHPNAGTCLSLKNHNFQQLFSTLFYSSYETQSAFEFGNISYTASHTIENRTKVFIRSANRLGKSYSLACI